MANDLTAVADAIRSNDRFLLVTHENPDGDALGSIQAMKFALEGAGKDVVAFLGGDTGIPREYAFMELDWLRRDVPQDAATRVLLALDCATASRTGLTPELIEAVPLSIEVDHHHDNTRFGAVNLVVPDASSTGEIVRDILRELGIELTPEIAEGLYIAVVTDTGRFMYTNTTPKAHLLAAELLEAGVDAHPVFREVYESVAFAQLKLLARALERARLYEDGRLVVTHLLRSDFTELGVGEEYAEGIIDHLRAIEGVEMAATIREPPEPPDAPRRMSLRSSREDLDVSVIARKGGGGGHARAAGFSSPEPIDRIVEYIRSEFVAQNAPARA